MKTTIMQLLAATLLLGLLAQPMLAEATGGGSLRFGNRHHQYCRGLGICSRDPGPTCPIVVDVEFEVISATEITLAFHDLPARLESENSFGTDNYAIPNPQRFGYKLMTILAGDYPFDWKTETVTVKFQGERDSTTLFSDLSSPASATPTYQCCQGERVSGSSSQGGISFTAANQFQPANSGSVSQIDVAVSYVSGVNSFYVALYTDNDGLPGTQLAAWSDLSSSTASGGCCGLVTISGISGVNLLAGTDYWLVVGPTAVGSTTWEMLNLNSVGMAGIQLISNDAGNTWNSQGQQTLSAFDILSGSSPSPPAQ